MDAFKLGNAGVTITNQCFNTVTRDIKETRKALLYN